MYLVNQLKSGHLSPVFTTTYDEGLNGVQKGTIKKGKVSLES